MYTTYILQSEKDGKYYIGCTKNVNNRITQHNNGYSRYTKNRGPFKLVYKEDYSTGPEAKKREYYLKSLKNKQALEKMIDGPIV